MKIHPHPHLTRRFAPASGRSIIELMVVMVISAVVLGAVLATMVSSTNSGRRTDSAGRLLENGELALQILARELRMSGYGAPRNYFSTTVYPTKNLSLIGIRGCDNGFTNARGGAAAANLAALQCNGLAANNNAGVSVAYEVDQFNATVTAAGTPVDCQGNGLVQNSGAAGVGNAQSQATSISGINGWFWNVENRYYVATTGDGDTALYCVGNGAATSPFFRGDALVRGVERMVLRYGAGRGIVDNDGPGNMITLAANTAQYMSANDIDTNANWGVETPVTRWQRITSVLICLEMVGEVGSIDPNSSFINCDDVTTTIADRRMRRAVRMQVNLRNRTVPAPPNIVY